jgi:UDP-N-acetylmuramate dehydrogenase
MTTGSARFAGELAGAIAGEVKASVPLGRYSTYRIGGPATVVLPASPEDVAVALRLAARAGRPVFPLGLGSNVLLPDDGLEPLVIRIGKGTDGVRSEEARWRLGAGMPAPLAARKTAEQGWAGLHVMVGVPGTVGGGVFMNAGCHGGEWSDVVERVTVVDLQGNDRVLEASEIPFSYRRSGLEGVIILEVEVRLRPGERADLEEEVRRLFAWRQDGTPFNQPCCGSVFKNPEPPAPAGWTRPWTAGSLLEAAELKGRRVGGAEVSAMHANYFVNTGAATAADVRGLIVEAREAVRRRFGVALETEVKVIGSRGEYLHV